MADRFHFFNHSRPAGTNRRYEIDSDTDHDTEQPSPRMPSSLPPSSDVEAQHTPETTERQSRFALPRWSRPTIPSFLSMGGGRAGPRPSSSHYSDDPERETGLETPKAPGFVTLVIPNLPSTRLHLPNLQRTWTQGSNGPPSRPTTARPDPGPFSRPVEGVTEPIPAVMAQDGQRTRRQGRGRRRADRSNPAHDGRRRRGDRNGRHGRSHGSSSGEGRGRLMDENAARRGNREDVTEGAGRHRSDSARIHRHGQRHRHRRQGSDCSRAEARPHPKRFLFCFPWIRSKRMRSQILRCFVSGLFLTLLLAVYLALSITRNINNSEFTVLLILVILFVTIFFCYGLIRLCMSIARSGKDPQQEEDGGRARLPQMVGHGGYAVPRQPIRVVLARDEEAAGLESETTKISPPAYGLWRESVRVDPNRIYWVRNDAAPPTTLDAEPDHEEHDPNLGSTRSDTAGGSHEMTERARPIILRPPSYASEDGVSYIVEARGRSIAPTTDVPLSQHFVEAGMTPRW